jgi:hypothetical protein
MHAINTSGHQSLKVSSPDLHQPFNFAKCINPLIQSKGEPSLKNIEVSGLLRSRADRSQAEFQLDWLVLIATPLTRHIQCCLLSVLDIKLTLSIIAAIEFYFRVLSIWLKNDTLGMKMNFNE